MEELGLGSVSVTQTVQIKLPSVNIGEEDLYTKLKKFAKTNRLFGNPRRLHKR